MGIKALKYTKRSTLSRSKPARGNTYHERGLGSVVTRLWNIMRTYMRVSEMTRKRLKEFATTQSMKVIMKSLPALAKTLNEYFRPQKGRIVLFDEVSKGILGYLWNTCGIQIIMNITE